MTEQEILNRELRRLSILRSYELMDSPPDPKLDELTALVSLVCEAPIAIISLVDDTRIWFKSKFGLNAPETDRNSAFCAQAIETPDQLTVVTDALTDPRFCENSLVRGAPHVRFYAGAPLKMDEGIAFGTMCVIDTKPRVLSDVQRQCLLTVANQVVSHFQCHVFIRSMEAAAEGQEGRLGALLSAMRMGILFERCRWKNRIWESRIAEHLANS